MIDSGFDTLKFEILKVSSNKKTWGINKYLRFFIKASNIRRQIFLILLNLFHIYNQ